MSQGGWYDYGSTRPLKNVTDISGNYFASGWGGNHEVKFGFGYRNSGVTSVTVYGGLDERIQAWDFGPGASYAWVQRDGITAYEGDFWYAFLGDTFTKDRLTVNAGLRFDSQSGNNKASAVEANPAFPQILPALDYDGSGVWHQLEGRLAARGPHLRPQRRAPHGAARLLRAVRQPAQPGAL